MLVRRNSRCVILMVLMTGISACSLTHAPKTNEENQQAALQRWHNCIESNRVGFEGAVIDVHQRVSSLCEGHQRDVLATFPEHLENQVDTLLSQRSTRLTAEHFLRSSNVMTWKKP